jgi:regulator of replication initiation timing
MPSKAMKIRKVTARILILLMVLVAIYFLIKPLAVIDYKIARLLDENERLTAEKTRLEKTLDKLESEIEKGKTMAGFEQKAREKLQMIYDGEQIYICKDSLGMDLRQENEIISVEMSTRSQKTIFSKVWDIVLSLFR